MPSTQPRPSPRRRTHPHRLRTLAATHPLLTFALLSALCVLLAYGKALSNPFVYDDLDTVVRNPNLATVHTLTHRFLLAPVSFSNEFRAASTLTSIGTTSPTSSTGSTWRPLFWLSLALDRRLYGPTAPTGFHATNLLLHWLNGLLLVTLLRSLRLRPLLAATAALLWLILPINSEPVAWVSGRAYLLCLLFLLAALHAALRYLETARPLALAAVAAASSAALLSNELGLLLPALTLLLAYTLHETPLARPASPTHLPLSPKPSAGASRSPASPNFQISGTPFQSQPDVSLRSIRLTLILVATDALYLTLRHTLHVSSSSAPPALWAIAPTLCKYLAWAIFPLHMSVERSTATPPNLPTPFALLACAALLALLAAPIFLRRRLPTVAAGMAVTLLALLPFCGVVPLYQGMAERFLYLPSVGLALTLTSLALSYAGQSRRASLAALALFAGLGALRLHARVADWSDPATLYGSSLAATPASPTLYFNLGFTARERGNLLTAQADYLRATELQPTYGRAFASLGDIDAQLHQPVAAIAAFRRALALNPGDAPTTTALALALQSLGDLPAAEQTFDHALELTPADPTTHTDLAVLLSAEGRTDAAIREFQQAMALNPNDPTPYFDLGTLFQHLHQDDVALPFYRKALALNPDDPETLFHISQLHLSANHDN